MWEARAAEGVRSSSLAAPSLRGISAVTAVRPLMMRARVVACELWGFFAPVSKRRLEVELSGVRAIHLEVERKRTQAASLYAKSGFGETGRRLMAKRL